VALIVFLGKLADLAGRESETLEISVPLDWADILSWIDEWYPDQLYAEIVGPRVRVAIDGVLQADKEALRLQMNSELAFLPPVSGG
jgi:molybdopterin synthase sulfur carrier subunit